MTAASSVRPARAREPRIAFLAAYMNNAYEWDIWKGVRAAVEERGGSVVCFAGAAIEDPDPERHARSSLFELVQAPSVDGILCLTSVLGNHAGIGAVDAWLSSKGLPAFSIGPCESVPSVSIADASGISQLMEHLVQHHQLRRIAFIKGTPSNTEAQRRYEAYVQALSAYGISYDPQLVLDGDFTAESGARAIYELFDKRQVSLTCLDAVVASNDYMAFGAIEELERRRVSVPDQVAVVGFDDIGPAKLYTPELTTVRQPLEELGRRAAQRLLDQLAGGSVTGGVTLPTELVLRRSCGCVPTSRRAAIKTDSEPPSAPGNLSGRALRNALSAELHDAPGTFVDVVEPLLRQVAAGGGADLHQCRRFVDDFSSRVRLARQDLIYERLTRLARVLHTKMFGPQAHVSMALAQHLPAFGVQECAVSEFVDAVPASQGKTLKLAFGFDAGSLQPQMVTFEGHYLVPESFASLRRRSVVVMPLTCGPQSLGIAVVPAVVKDGNFYETLAELFATILKVLEIRRSKA